MNANIKRFFNTKISIAICYLLFAISAASAADFKYSGYGTAGGLWGDNNDFVGDFRLRTELRQNNFGASFAIDELSVYTKKYVREAMGFYESDLGRVEIGLTDSVATKMGLGLPDVGGLRINDNSFLFRFFDYDGAVISKPLLSSGWYAPRINLVSAPGRWQFGLSAAGLSDKYKYLGDFAVRFRAPEGKVKTSVSFGASYIDSPENFQTDMFSPTVTASSRTQISAGLNLQYLGFIWGTTVRAIYDENPIGIRGDGVNAGTGLSYDILKYSVSGTYYISSTGIWDDTAAFVSHTGVLSARYKYSKYFDIWMSGGVTTGEPFVSAGVRLTF